MEIRLNQLVSRRVPLVEFTCILRQCVSAEVACEAVNRLSDNLAAYSHGITSKRFGLSMIIQMDPGAAPKLGMVIARVPLNADDPSVGYKWECYGFGRLEEFVGKLIERIDVSLPGSFDDGQAWSA